MNQSTKPTVGLPNGLMYPRDQALITAFLIELGIPFVVSGESNRETLHEGSRVAADESCLAMKMYLGHVASLIGKCSCILVPRVSNYGHHRQMCCRFEAAYDLARAVFHDEDVRFVDYEIDVRKKKTEEQALISLGRQLGASLKDSARAYKTAFKLAQKDWKTRVKEEEALLHQPGHKVLLVGHDYVVEDAYIGQPVLNCLQDLGVTSVRAYLVDRKAALRHSLELSPTCKWEYSRELVGSAVMRKDQVSGIVLISTFPCGPDALVHELLLRRIDHKPMLNLVLDGQSGTAGLETRLESFVDIIRFQEGHV